MLQSRQMIFVWCHNSQSVALIRGMQENLVGLTDPGFLDGRGLDGRGNQVIC